MYTSTIQSSKQFTVGGQSETLLPAGFDLKDTLLSVAADLGGVVHSCAECGEELPEVEEPESQDFRDEVARLLDEAGLHKEADRWRKCNKPGEGWFATCADDPTHYTGYIPYSCTLRICHRCAVKAAWKAAKRHAQIIETVIRKQWHKVKWGWRLRHVVLTSEFEINQTDDVMIVKRLLDATRDLVVAMWAEVEGVGALAGCEIGEHGKRFHVHLLVWSQFIDEAEIKQMWNGLTGQTYVHIKVVGKAGDYRAGNVGGVVGSAVWYCTKYVCKELDESETFTPQELVKLLIVLRGRRRVRSWLAFNGVKTEPEPKRCCPVCGGRLAYTEERYFQEQKVAWRYGQAAEGGFYVLNKGITFNDTDRPDG
jgi:hypothetical protein